MFIKTVLKSFILCFIILSIFSVGKISAQESIKNESEKNNAINLLPAFASLMTTLIMLPIHTDGDTFYLVAGIGYERKIADHFSIFGNGLFMFTFNPNMLVWMELILAGRYYINNPFTGIYVGLGIDYKKFDTPPVFLANQFGIKGLFGSKWKIGLFYIEPEIGAGISFGNFEMKFFDYKIFDYSGVSFVPALSINMGILF